MSPFRGAGNPPIWLILLNAFIWLGLLSACGVNEPALAVTQAAVQKTQELSIYNWDTYIDPEILMDFEQEFGVKIRYETFESSDAMVEGLKANPGAYDLIVPSDYAVETLRRDRLLSPLNKENIPNLKNLDPLFANPAYDPGNRFCVAYQWGMMGIGYNRKATGREISGWDDLFDPEFRGRVALLDSVREVLGGVLLYLGHSPNTTRQVEIGEARDFLIEQSQQIAAFSGDDGQELLVEGKVDLAYEYSGDILQVMEDNPDIRFVIPDEGAIVWTDNLCIPADAPNQEMAEKFINYILEPEVSAALSNFIRYSSPNQAAIPFLNQVDRMNPILYPPEEDRERLFFLVDVGPEAELFYQQAWAEVLAAHGQ